MLQTIAGAAPSKIELIITENRIGSDKLLDARDLKLLWLKVPKSESSKKNVDSDKSGHGTSDWQRNGHWRSKKSDDHEWDEEVHFLTEL